MKIVSNLLGAVSILIGVTGIGFIISPFGEITAAIYVIPFLGLLFGGGSQGVIWKINQEFIRKKTEGLQAGKKLSYLNNSGFWGVLLNFLAFSFASLWMIAGVVAT